MSSVTTLYAQEVPYYQIFDQSQMSLQNTNQFSYSVDHSQDKNNSKQIQSDKKNQSVDISHFKTPQDQKQKTPRQRTNVSLLPDALAKKTQSRKEQISIYFFNSDKRMSFQKEQVNKYFDKKQNVTIKQLIPFVVKSYCRLILNFQPVEIVQDSFQIKLANFENHDDGIIDPFSHSLPISYLYDADNLVLVRKARPSDKINDWGKLLNQKGELQIVQILMPQKKQLTLQVQRTKTVNYLKQKISSYTNQLGKIVLVSYNGFKICQNKRKVSDLDQKIFEVYREMVQDYIDKPIIKNSSSYVYNNVNFYEELWKAPSKDDSNSLLPKQFYVNETALYGKLTLVLSHSHIIQKYHGGVLSSFPLSWINSQERMKNYSIHTLVGIKNFQSQDLILNFMFKDRCEPKLYKFQQKDQKDNFLRNILKIGRIYNKKWERLK